MSRPPSSKSQIEKERCGVKALRRGLVRGEDVRESERVGEHEHKEEREK